ncbi:hypothetical protein C8J57DRAFT_1344236 [Mycena rebaudengoi]|nr:hypothetical protein C8J57DRAFT_1344236 [Mycena rebaudengoi]
MSSTLRRSTRLKAPAPAQSSSIASHDEPEEIIELRALAAELTACSFNRAWCPFLEKLQEVLDIHQPRDFNIFPTPIFWKDATQRKQRAKYFEKQGFDFEGMKTLTDWVSSDKANGRRPSPAATTTPAHGAVTQTLADWAAEPTAHLWVLFTVHAPPNRKGKTIVTYDTDVEPHHNSAREKPALGFEHDWVQRVRRKAGRENDPVWQNLPVMGGNPGGHECFRFTMEWLIRLVYIRLETKHDGGLLVELEGFRRIRP